jgi:hypothetical protein
VKAKLHHWLEDGSYAEIKANVLNSPLTQITISKLPHPEHHGDWHDKLLRWAVSRGAELQKFPTREEARIYASIRHRLATEQSAIKIYMARSLGSRHCRSRWI